MMLFEGFDGVIGPNFRLCDVAAALGRSTQSLKAMACRGDFPRVFRVSRNDCRVERTELEAWARGAWERESKREVRADAVRRSFRQPAAARRSGQR
jgi:hypothetical protein